MKKIKEYGLITFGIALISVALECLFFPNEIASGGVSGFALVVDTVVGIEPSITMFVLNTVLFIVAFFVLGKSFGAKSIYATVMLSVCLWIIENIIKPDMITDNLFLASFFGSLILAIGTAIVFNQGASTGGTSILAAIINKYTSLGIGTGLLITDSVVCMLAINAFGIERGLFGFFTVIMIGVLVDRVIDGFNKCKQVFIITQNVETVTKYITNDIPRGCTILNGEGGFTGSEVKIVYALLSTKEFIMLKKFLKENDPEAFVTVNESIEVLGEGFKSYT